ncbi:MAG: hypothetical protein KDK39_06520 [Leptospiraceae bacterium]|nr:hypothetical protein [Leptospiraceae bacterium]
MPLIPSPRSEQGERQLYDSMRSRLEYYQRMQGQTARTTMARDRMSSESRQTIRVPAAQNRDPSANELPYLPETGNRLANDNLHEQDPVVRLSGSKPDQGKTSAPNSQRSQPKTTGRNTASKSARARTAQPEQPARGTSIRTGAPSANAQKSSTARGNSDPIPRRRTHTDSMHALEAIFKNTSPVPGLPVDLTPAARGPYRYFAPAVYKGLYLHNYTARTASRYTSLLKQARKYKLNVLVVDVQPKQPPKEFIKLAREMDFYLVARVVVFEGGLRSWPPPRKHIDQVAASAQAAAQAGFMEVQLDYIRFTDYWKGRSLSLPQRYRTVATIIKHIDDQVRPLGVRIGADIFGRIPFNQNDRIGQKLEVFAPYLDTLYPMLYPSHFYGDPMMQKKPYKAVYDGCRKSVERIGHESKVVAYIQAFKMKVGMSGLGYQRYIYDQLRASTDAGGQGFVAWNARNQYATFFKAVAQYNQYITAQKQTVTSP